MNFKGLTKLAKTFGMGVDRNSPTILTSIAVAGVVGTTIMGAKDTIKAIRIIDELERDGALTNKERAKVIWKCYIPTAALGAITMGCVIGSNSINLRRNAAIASLYTLSETALKEYQAKVVEKIGENKDREIKDEIAKDRIRKDPVSGHEIILGRGETLCYDSMSGRYFYSDMESIKTAVNKINVRMRSEMFVTLSELYSELNIEGTKLGDLVGWYIDDGDFNPDFSSVLSEDGRPCLVLDFDTEPRYCDREF